jgi:hypothetical protein
MRQLLGPATGGRFFLQEFLIAIPISEREEVAPVHYDFLLQ